MVPELRPRGIGEILDAAVGLYRARFGRLVLAALAVAIPVQVLNTLVLLSAVPDQWNVSVTGQATPQYNNALVQLAGQLVVVFIGWTSTALATALCARWCAETYLGRATDDPAPALPRRPVLVLVGASLLVALCDLAGFAACGIGYLASITLLAVAMPALVVERTGAPRSIGRSVQLTSRNLLRVLGLVVTVQLLASVVNVGLGSVAAIVLGVSTNSAAYVVTLGVTNALTLALTQPLVAASLVVLYFDLRIRNEAFDVQLLMQRSDARHGAAQPTVAAAT